jgi:oxygen-dependent protoporphyrinogen oxidase
LIAVVGAGISGLAAAWRLADRFDAQAPGGPGRAGRARIVVLEGGPRVGGKLLQGAVGPVEVDLGAESVLARRP